jgi:hypothetical protein
MAEDLDVTLVVDSDALVDEPRERCFMRLRSIGVRVESNRSAPSERGVWEFIEKPRGLDAVVVVVWRRGSNGIEVLLRRGLRVPTVMGRPGSPRGPGRHAAPLVEETVAGMIEPGEEGEAAFLRRAQAEVAEEVGLELPLDRFTSLGGPLWGSPGISAEVLFWYAADATGAPEPHAAKGDGSPFETVGEAEWRSLDDAIASCGAGDVNDVGTLGDLRTELGFRRLKALLDG